MAKPYKDGKLFAIRRRFQGHEVFISGCKSGAAAKKLMDLRVTQLTSAGKPTGLGPEHTTLAQALQDYAMQRLRFMKGAVQEANRINRYLRAAGLATLKVARCKPSVTDVAAPAEPMDVTESDAGLEDTGPGKRTGKGKLFDISLQPPVAMRSIPKGLGGYRKSLAKSTASSDAVRDRLARMAMAKVTSDDVQALISACRDDEREPATVHQERALIRRIFNYCVFQPIVDAVSG